MSCLQPNHQVFKFSQCNSARFKTCFCKFRFQVGFTTAPESKYNVIIFKITNSVRNFLQFPEEVQRRQFKLPAGIKFVSLIHAESCGENVIKHCLEVLGE